MTTDAAVDNRPIERRQGDLRRLVFFLVLLAAGGAYYAYARHEARKPYAWSGTIEARAVAIGSRTGGRVKQVLVREGDRVVAGQPIVVLEPGELEAELAIATAQLAQAQAELDKLEKGARPEEIQQARARAAAASAVLDQSRTGARAEEVAVAKARLAATEAALEQAGLDVERSQKLFAGGAVSKSEVDSSQTQLKSATAQRDALKHSLDELVNGERREKIRQAEALAMEAQANVKLVSSGTRAEDLRAAQAVVQAVRARVDAIQIKISELTIRAPAVARVEAFDLRPGDLVAPNAPAATLLEDEALYVRIYVPETLLGLIQVGTTVPVVVDTFGDRSFQGVIEHISSVGEFSPRNLQTADERANQVFATRVELKEGKDQLRAGMSAFIKVPRP